MNVLDVRFLLEVFVTLFEKGYIYRDNYMVNWDPGSRSAISELEVGVPVLWVIEFLCLRVDLRRLGAGGRPCRREVALGG